MSSSSKILIFGRGQVGAWLRNLRPQDNQIVSLGQEDFDFLNTSSAQSILNRYRPKIVINASAYTNVDSAEDVANAEMAMRINALTPFEIAKWCRANDALMVHYSSDYVFDGKKQGAYLETDRLCPINRYGESKARGDELVSEVGGKFLILRSSWIYSWLSENFFLKILRLAHEREELKIVCDQIGAPTYAKILANTTWKMVDTFRPDRSGVYNTTSPDHTSWYEFAKRFLELDVEKSRQTLKRLLPIATKDYPSKLVRPLNSTLDNTKLKIVFGIQLPSWREQVDELYKDRPS